MIVENTLVPYVGSFLVFVFPEFIVVFIVTHGRQFVHAIVFSLSLSQECRETE